MGPDEGVVLLGEHRQRSCNISIVLDEWSLVTQDSQDASDLLHCFRGTRPISQSICLLGVNSEFIPINYKPQVFNMLYPQWISNLVNSVFPCRCLMMLLIRGSGYMTTCHVQSRSLKLCSS